MFNRRRLPIDLLALVLLGLVVFVALALWTHDPADPPGDSVFPLNDEVRNLCGPSGATVANNLRNLMGLGAWLLPIALGSCGLSWLLREDSDRPITPLAGCTVLLIVGCTALRGLAPGLSGSPPVGSGGFLGAWLWTAMESEFTEAGILILLGSMTAAGLLMAFDRWSWKVLLGFLVGPYVLFHRLGFGDRSRKGEEPYRRRETPIPTIGSLKAADAEAAPAPHIEVAPLPATLPLAENADEAESNERVAATDPDPIAGVPSIELAHDADIGKIVVPPIGTVPSAGTDSHRNEGDEPPVVAPVTPPTRQPIRINPPAHTPRSTTITLPQRPPARPEYKLPSPSILELAEPFPFEILAEKARLAATVLERTFQEFGLNVRVVEIDTGPVITQFELELEAGLRLSKVTALADDLAIALRVPSVRVVAPIPGKNTVGVEVPNDKQVMVRLRELIEASPDAGEKKRIPVFLGKDVSGRPLVVDLAKMPHLLIAGRTGTGKSVCLNALILSILMTRTPEQVKMLMIDPKMVELSPYKRVPHLMHPVITDMKKAEAVLGWAVDKMEERYDLLARCGVRHLDSYNELGREFILQKLGLDPESEEAEQIPDRMPYIVIIADEMADMMMTSGKEVEGFIIRLAQKSRAVGIHLVLATQKPTVDVITGLIKSNLPARIAFQVASRVDSRVVLDEMGADKLLGNGDMLYLIPGTSKITRAQGTYVADSEVNSVIDFFGDCEPEYSRELAQLSTRPKGKSGIEAIRSRDEMYEQAIDVVVREGRGSVSLLQRALGIGYGRAARLVDYMAEDGIVGDYNGSQAREVLYTPEQWAELVAGGEPVMAN